MYWKFERVVFLIAIIWYSFTAYKSIGYYHADEQYQIIEFAGAKTGKSSADELPWEFREQIRPAIQPAISYVVFEVSDFFSVTDPYHQAFILRLLTGVLAVISIYIFTQSCKSRIASQYWKPFLLTSYFLWFLPFVNVRFSSEIWSGMTFLLAMSIVLRERKDYKAFLLMGVLLGLSFLFRYQIAIAAIGLYLWLLLIRKEHISRLLVSVVAIMVIIAGGILLDSWFYGDLVIAPWNYLTSFLGSSAPEFGTSPWYTFVRYIFRYSFFPFGLLIICSFLFLSLKRPANVFTWVVLPFIIVHSFIGHKELRFLFPLINLIPIIFFLAIQEIGWSKVGPIYKKVLNVLIILLVLVNLCGLVVGSIKPAGVGRIEITRTISEVAPEEPVNLLYFENSNPYDPWGGLPAGFYMEQEMNFKKVDSLQQVDSTMLVEGMKNFLVLKKQNQQDPQAKMTLSGERYDKVAQSIPEYLVPFLKVYGYKTEDILLLYRIRE